MRRIEEFWIEFYPPAVEDDEPKTSGLLSLIYDVADSIKGAVIVVFLVFALMFRAIGVDGDSMFPTLNDGDWVAISGVTVNVERGDIVVLTQPWERNVPIITLELDEEVSVECYQDKFNRIVEYLANV